MESEEVDLYEVLGIDRSAGKSDIKKAYHKAALSSHPDKVAEEEREEAEIKFKSVSRAYEILYNDETREMYDMHGMAAFEKGGAGGGGMPGDMEEMLAQMFASMGGGGMPGGFGGFADMGAGPGRPRKSKNEVQQYDVTLEELYKGKTTRFASTKNVICQHCHGTGGKEKAKAKQCGTCNGSGTKTVLRPVGPGLVTQETVPCSTCNGRGSYYSDKDKCKKCKGNRTVLQKKLLELYIPRGSRQGDRIVLSGEADQVPDQEPGDIIFELVEEEHETFHRAGADLQADLKITLAEALTGFNRTVVTHLDGRGISLNVKDKIVRPDEVFKVEGEGMPIKKSEAKGDLYLTVKIEFPKDDWFKDETQLQKIRDQLPPPNPVVSASTVDEVSWKVQDNMESFGAGSGDPRAGEEWEDDDMDGEEGEAQCAQQ